MSSRASSSSLQRATLASGAFNKNVNIFLRGQIIRKLNAINRVLLKEGADDPATSALNIGLSRVAAADFTKKFAPSDEFVAGLITSAVLNIVDLLNQDDTIRLSQYISNPRVLMRMNSMDSSASSSNSNSSLSSYGSDASSGGSNGNGNGSGNGSGTAVYVEQTILPFVDQQTSDAAHLILQSYYLQYHANHNYANNSGQVMTSTGVRNTGDVQSRNYEAEMQQGTRNGRSVLNRSLNYEPVSDSSVANYNSFAGGDWFHSRDPTDFWFFHQITDQGKLQTDSRKKKQYGSGKLAPPMDNNMQTLPQAENVNRVAEGLGIERQLMNHTKRKPLFGGLLG